MSELLAEWRRRFVDANACPWPGPRPLLDSEGRKESRTAEEVDRERVEARRQLRGRDIEVYDLGMTCLSNHLVVVHGQSGVGKSSIINAGLVPELEASGKIVILRKDWGTAGNAQPSAYVSELAIESERLTHDPFARGTDTVDRDFPNQLVYILDQFEELIRSDPAFAHKVLSWIEEVAGKTSAKFVISLRSEYEWQLRDLHTKPFTKRARFEIQPIEDLDTIRTIIGGDPDDVEEPALPVDLDVVTNLVSLWQRAQADETTTMWNKPGLLHLQATMYVLWMAAVQRQGGATSGARITKDDLKSFIRQHQDFSLFGSRRDEGRDPSLFGFGLERSVEASIRNCDRACDPQTDPNWTGVRRVMKDQTRWIFRDITQHLASGGYKTPRQLWDLAHLVLGALDEPSLKTTPVWAARLYADADWLGASPSRFEVAEYPDAALATFASGPASGLSADALLFELYRCFFFALEWMKQANIVQIRPSGGSFSVTLTHDRFSEGLADWRTSQEPNFSEAVSKFLAYRGKEDLSWSSLEAGLTAERLVVNVRWKQCVVEKTTFKDVSFVNCDFAGSTFRDCVFDGAVFVNCVLDDVDFVGCAVLGAPTWRYSNEQWKELDADVRRPWTEDPPTFTVPVSDQFAARLTTEQSRPEVLTPLQLVSPPSGAVVASVEASALQTASKGPEPELPLTRGGLVMCGGRLSSLTFRRCTFLTREDERMESEGPRVVLRHVAGTSLEICEQTHGSFDLFAAAVRGLAVTLPVGYRPEAEGDVPRFQFDVRHAKVINTWFGVDLVGEADFHDCNVWQLINASDKMTIAITNSGYFGLINTGPVEDELSFPLGVSDFTEAHLSGRAIDSVRKVSANIDVQELS